MFSTLSTIRNRCRMLSPMAVARGVQGGRHLLPPQPPGRWKKIDEDYSNWLGIKNFLEQFVYKRLLMIICFFYIFIWKYLYDWRFHCVALLHKLKLIRTRQIIDLEQVWYMYSIALPYCWEHAWRNMAVWVVAWHTHGISLSLHSAYTHTHTHTHTHSLVPTILWHHILVVCSVLKVLFVTFQFN